MRELKEKEMTEMPFRPQTNEGRNQMLLQEIIEEDL